MVFQNKIGVSNALMKSQVSVSVLATSLSQYQVSLSGHLAFLCDTVHVYKDVSCLL